MKTITCEEYKKKCEEGFDHVTLDVRTTEEFAEGHVEDAVNVPLPILDVKIADVIPDKKTTIISCCKSGGRATTALHVLEKMGYEDVRLLEGGYLGYCGKDA